MRQTVQIVLPDALCFDPQASGSFKDGQHGHGAAEVEQATAEGSNVLVVAGTGAEEVAQLVVPKTEPCR